MKILITTECLRFGGAQIFALRLAKYLSKDHEVLLYYHFKDYMDRKMVTEEFEKVDLIYPRFPFLLDLLIRKVDRAFYYLRVDFSLRNILVVPHIRRVLSRHTFDIIHSHMFKSNYLFAKAMKGLATPLVVTTHGCYENFLNSHNTGLGEKIFNYPEKLVSTLKRIDGIAYLTDKNSAIIDRFIKNYKENRVVRKIYNGYVKKDPDLEFSLSLQVSIQEGEMVFGMVARGIKEKGWREAIEAFKLLDGNHHLILVGDSDYLQRIKKITTNERIYFVGFSEKPVNWINTFDVGLLPSYFPAESLPNSVVECLSLGKPIIASNIGEIQEMITTGKESCGYTLPLVDGKVDPSQLMEKMRDYILNPSTHKKHSELALECAQKFDMGQCATNYLNLYEQTFEKKNNTSSDS